MDLLGLAQTDVDVVIIVDFFVALLIAALCSLLYFYHSLIKQIPDSRYLVQLTVHPGYPYQVLGARAVHPFTCDSDGPYYFHSCLFL